MVFLPIISGSFSAIGPCGLFGCFWLPRINANGVSRWQRGRKFLYGHGVNEENIEEEEAARSDLLRGRIGERKNRKQVPILATETFTFLVTLDPRPVPLYAQKERGRYAGCQDSVKASVPTSAHTVDETTAMVCQRSY
jgi:hypothetical protein